MTMLDDMKRMRELSAGGKPAAEVMRQEAPAGPPRCPCGAAVDPDLLELRETFPSLYRGLCGKCYEIDRREAEQREARDRANAEHRHRLAALDRVIPAELLATDTGHQTFNAGLLLAAERWLAITGDTGRWLVITGEAGRCKSRVVALLAKRMILDGVRVAWCRATDFQRTCEELWVKDPMLQKNAFAQLREWSAAEVLVLDDLGKNTWSELIETKLFDLIDGRKSRMKTTIITANTPLAELMKLMTKERRAPIVGRILEASEGWQLKA